MASRRFSRKPPSANLCSEWAADDGLDPRFDVKPGGKVSNRKALQLCRQAQRVLSFALKGELLRDMVVESVVPAPDSSRLLVALRFHGDNAISDVDLDAALVAAHAQLRMQVSCAIHRRKTPELIFRVLRSR
jgi:ribosome-binding factor A